MRLLVAVLVVLNLLLFAWNRGWVPAPGDGAALSAREPQRLERQVNAESVRLVADPTAPPAVSADTAPSPAAPDGAAVCLEAGPFGAAEAERAERVLAALPPGSWRRVDADGAVVLRIDTADATIRAQLQALDAGGLGVGFGPCAAP